MRPRRPPGACKGTAVDKSVFAWGHAGRAQHRELWYASNPPAFYAATDRYLASPIGPGNEHLRLVVLELLGRTTPCQ